MTTTKPKRIPRQLTVRHAAALGPHLRRITLGGPELAGFPDDSAGSYIKLLLPKPAGDGETFVRTYTVRHYRPDLGELDLDIVMHTQSHGEPGPGAAWAASVQPGDTVAISGPGSATFADPEADWFLFAGDLAAYPAICANLERLAPTAQGCIFIESEEPLQGLPACEQFDVQWVAPSSDLAVDALVDAVRAVNWRPGRAFVWAAAEFDQMKQLRRHFKRERGLSSKDLYISSYWKQGLREEEHKVVKREDAQANAE